jgi:hypothetical protein
VREFGKDGAYLDVPSERREVLAQRLGRIPYDVPALIPFGYSTRLIGKGRKNRMPAMMRGTMGP